MTDAKNNRRLAELNIARLSYAQGDPRVAEFMHALERVNAVAERSDGFVWRLKDEDGPGATGISFGDDPNVIVNMSVWSSVEGFERFVWNTVHKRFYEKRGQWFDRPAEAHFVMWWIEPGHTPTLAEAAERLEDLRANGPSERAFGWESLPSAKLWRQARCA